MDWDSLEGNKAKDWPRVGSWVTHDDSDDSSHWNSRINLEIKQFVAGLG